MPLTAALTCFGFRKRQGAKMAGGDETFSHDDSLRTMLVSQSLTSLWFVHDYVHLWFNYMSLTLVTTPSMIVGTTSFGWSDAGHRDILCAQIDQVVTETRVAAGVHVELAFDTGVKLLVPLDDTSYRGAEAAIFRGMDDYWWVI